MFERLSDEGLAQSSFLIACERTRTAAVIDPRRDIDAYTTIAARHGLTLIYAIETGLTEAGAAPEEVEVTLTRVKS